MRRLAIFLSVLNCLVACTSEREGPPRIVVEVDSNLSVPDELDRIALDVAGQGAAQADLRTEGLPRTNNDLEQFFGRHRYHERRASGRKGASPALVLRGAARVVAAAATRQRVYTAKELSEVNRAEWKRLRGELETRRQRRTERTRCRRDPQAFLSQLEEKLLQPVLPP